MITVQFQRTPCPSCSGTKHTVIASRQSGVVLLRYHSCPCGAKFRSTEMVQPVRRKAKVPRVD